MNTFGVYRVRSKTHMLDLSAGFCRRVADWLIYNTFMLTPDKVNLQYIMLTPDKPLKERF
jgi:hypothetical protein